MAEAAARPSATAPAAAAAAMKRRLLTPEGVDLGLTLAGAGQRMAAFLLDGAIMIAILIAMTLLAAMNLISGAGGSEAVLIVWLLGFFLLRNCYFIAMEMGPRAATFGKRIVGLRVVARSGGRLTADAVIARNLVREIEVYLPLSFLGYSAAQGAAGVATTLFGLGWACLFLFFPLFNKDRLRIGDMLAGTWVIDVPRRRLTTDLMAPAEGGTGAGTGWAFTEEQLDAYGIFELQTLERVLRDRNLDSMTTVAWTIRNKIGYGEIESSEAFLGAYYEALRRRLERKLLFGRRRADKFDR
jgi:uncharacterized RDD family membrane protein YckC